MVNIFAQRLRFRVAGAGGDSDGESGGPAALVVTCLPPDTMARPLQAHLRQLFKPYGLKTALVPQVRADYCL